MLLTVQVEAGAHTALSVPELAVLGDGEDRFVYIVDDQGKAQRTEVRTGARQDGRIEIVDGLSRGQKVVTDGIVKLSDGLPVRVTKNAGAAGSKENMMARSEEHTSELQSLMRISYAVFCLKKKKKNNTLTHNK